MEEDHQEIEKRGNENPEVDYSFRCANLFIVDGTQGMHRNRGPNTNSYFQEALAMYERILRQKLIRNRDDWMGLVLFATTTSDPEIKNILTVLEFGQVSVEMLKKLLYIQNRKLPYYASIASEVAYPLSQILLHAARSFDSIKKKMTTRQVNLITCHDDPPFNDNDARQQAFIVAKNFKDIQVGLKVVGFGDSWSFDFYKQLEMLASDSDKEPKRSLPLDIEREVMKRQVALGQIDLRIGEKVLMKVQLQTITKTRPTLRKIAMDKATNEPLDSYFHYKKIDDFFDDEEPNEDDDDSEDIMNSSIRKWQRVGGRDILLTLKEAKGINQLKPKGIEILRFEKALKEPPWYHIPPALFLGVPVDASPNEKKLFAALFVKCQEKGVMAICAATVRANGRTHLFRMWPCPEYHGFNFTRIPFEEEINKSHEALMKSEATDGLEMYNDEKKLNIMEKVIKRFRINYSPAIFPNPKLSKQQQYILALALNEEWDEEKNFEDFTKPAVDILQMSLSKRGLLDSFFEIFRSTMENEINQAVKVVRYDRETAERMIQGNLSMYTVPQLRALLRALNQPITGVKAVLIERCQDYARAM